MEIDIEEYGSRLFLSLHKKFNRLLRISLKKV